jgi:hypothetical protein
VLTSIDASAWTVVPELSGLAHVVGPLGDMAVALGDGVVLSSADGMEWTRTRQPALAGAGFTATVELADGRILATGLTDANGSTRPTIWVGEPATVANSAARFAELYDAWDAAIDRIWKGRKSVPLKTLKKRARADIAQTQRLLSGLRSWPWPEEVRAEAEAYTSSIEQYQQTGRKLSRAPDSRRWRRLIKTDKAQRSAQAESFASFTVALGLAES